MNDERFERAESGSGQLQSVHSTVKTLLGVPSDAAIGADGTWTVPHRDVLPVALTDARGLQLLALAAQYDEATERMATWTSIEHVARIEQNRYAMATFADSARLLAAVIKLELQVKKAAAIQLEAKEALRTLHDRKSPEALTIEKRLNSQITLIREQLDKQVRKFDRFRTQCQTAVNNRLQEARTAEERARDKATMSDMEVTLKALRDISNEASGIIRSSRLSEITLED